MSWVRAPLLNCKARLLLDLHRQNYCKTSLANESSLSFCWIISFIRFSKYLLHHVLTVFHILTPISDFYILQMEDARLLALGFSHPLQKWCCGLSPDLMSESSSDLPWSASCMAVFSSRTPSGATAEKGTIEHEWNIKTFPKQKLFRPDIWCRSTLSEDRQSMLDFFYFFFWMELKKEKIFSHRLILFLLLSSYYASRGCLWFHIQAVSGYCSGLDKRGTLLYVITAWIKSDNLLWLNQLLKKRLFLSVIWLVYFCNILAHFLLLHAWMQAWSNSAELTLFSLERRLEKTSSLRTQNVFTGESRWK